MFPPVPCWPDKAAVTFHYEDLSVVYHRDPISGDVIPLDNIPKVGLCRIILWMERTPLLEVSLSPGQRPIFSRLESDKFGIARAYLVGWQQNIDGKSIQSIGYYLPPNSSSPGRIVVAGEYEQGLIDRFNEPDFRQTPIPCWPDSTTYSFYYQDGSRIDRLNRETGEEITSENMPREGLKKVALWHHDMPVVECHYQKGQQAIFRRRNEWKGNTSVVVGQNGLPMEALAASTNWFANKKAREEGKYNAFYLLGWKQPIGSTVAQSIAYFYPQNGDKPPRVVLAGRFCAEDDSYLPIPVGNDTKVVA